MEDTDGLLNQFERQILAEPYKSYVTNRRNNWQENVRIFRPLWNCFMLLNDVWQREIRDLNKNINDDRAVFPYFLLVTAHSKVQVVINLAHAVRLLTKPELVKVWLNRDNDEDGKRAWRDEFWFNKETKLFAGLPELHAFWKWSSDFGSHANENSLMHRYYPTGEKEGDYALHYSGARAEELPKFISLVLQMLCNLENRLFESTEKYLQSDSELSKMRKELYERKMLAFQQLGIVVINCKVTFVSA